MKHTSTYLCAVVSAAALALVLSSCPNACAGHGTCEFNDKCSCQGNWAGADCSLRVCPADWAHATASQGDRNADGDLVDNSYKAFPSVGGVVGVTTLSAAVTHLAVAAGYTTLTVGDGVIIEGKKFTVISPVTTTSFTLDRVYPGATDSSAVAYKFLQNQAYPEGTWEGWPGWMVAAEDQGHFYMECSNRGLCDRKAGTCKCFPGYDGTACQRTVCPNDCSGHGTCEKVSELATQQPSALACTLFGALRGAVDIFTFNDCTSVVSAQDSLMVGDEAVAHTASAVIATKITLATPLTKDIPSGAAISAVRSYGLWDADKNRACKCDARYQGYDCSERKCPYGDDTLTGSQVWETQVIDIGGNAAAAPANKITGSFKLVFTDMFGEKWTTGAIPVDGGVDKSVEVRAALKALPNAVVQDVSVTSLPIGHATASDAAATGVRYHVKFNGGTTTTATGNSGDLPAMECDTSALVSRMLVNAAAAATAATASGVHTVTFGGAQTGVNIPIVGDMLALFLAGPGALIDDVTILSSTAPGDQVFTTTAPAAGTVAFAAILRKIAGAECVISDTALIRSAAAQALEVDGTVASAGDKLITLSAAIASASLAVGDKLRIWTSAAVNEVVTVSSITSGTAVTTVEAIVAAHANKKVEFYGKGTMEQAACSNRGLCDSASGVCKCFKGYTMDDCSRQSALAM